MNKTKLLIASVLLAAPLVRFAAPGDGPVKGDRSFTVSVAVAATMISTTPHTGFPANWATS